MADAGITLRFYTHLQGKKIFDADILFINSYIFKPFWKNSKDEIFSFLRNAQEQRLRIFWFDNTDSTWSTQFEVLPYVEMYLKNQIFKNKSLYLKRFHTGRIFTDYFDNLYQSGERETDYFIPKKNDLSKVNLSWNSCFENYTKYRYSKLVYLKHLAFPLTSRYVRSRFKFKFTAPDKPRVTDINLRVGLSHSRPSIVSHRRATIKLLKIYNDSFGKVSLKKYFKELQSSKIGLSPFGLGEITLRDYEIIICGAALMKPDLTHMETWPDYYVNNKTYLPFKWDFS
ncbi:MAG: hypothetical protein IH852_09390 [Bacteroidetes bacterium]|nr:hypothetical protein [Bacteroidota bacterium]